jgi:hypothetical protein
MTTWQRHLLRLPLFPPINTATTFSRTPGSVSYIPLMSIKQSYGLASLTTVNTRPRSYSTLPLTRANPGEDTLMHAPSLNAAFVNVNTAGHKISTPDRTTLSLQGRDVLYL